NLDGSARPIAGRTQAHWSAATRDSLDRIEDRPAQADARGTDRGRASEGPGDGRGTEPAVRQPVLSTHPRHGAGPRAASAGGAWNDHADADADGAARGGTRRTRPADHARCAHAE